MEDVIIRVAVFVDDISGELLIEPWAEAAVTFLATDDGLSLIAIVGVALGLGVFAGVLTSGPANAQAETAAPPKPADEKPLVDPKTAALDAFANPPVVQGDEATEEFATVVEQPELPVAA